MTQGVLNRENRKRTKNRVVCGLDMGTTKICAIIASGPMEDNSSCEAEKELLMSILQKKYPEKQAKDPMIKELIKDFHEIFGRNVISQEDRSIMVRCHGFSDITLEIRYFDMKLYEQAKKESLEMQGKAVDSSGL